MTNEWMKKKRAECKSKGICTQCHKRKVKKGKVKCKKCMFDNKRVGGEYVKVYEKPFIKKDVTNQTIGCWFVTSFSYHIKYIKDGRSFGSNHYWRTKCTNCGNESDHSISGASKSKCGNCLLRPKGESGRNALYASYRSDAERRAIDFNLTKEEFEQLTSQNCHYCGSKPKHVRRCNQFAVLKKENFIRSEWGNYTYNGIDRTNNNLGYNLNNCVTACLTCNRAKNDMSFEDFEEYLDQIAKFRVLKWIRLDSQV